MKNSRKKNIFARGRKFVFTLALFVLVFAAASAVKVQAAGNVTGWLWGGGAGNPGNTNVGWISMSSVNPGAGGSVDYGVNIPLTNGLVTGYAWSENIGWVSFNAGDLSGCPSGTCNASRDGNYLKGWAKIMSIPQAGANAGGWAGWISLSGANYGVEISKMDGTGSNPTYAWSNELGWIDFSRAHFPQLIVTLQPESFNLTQFLNSSQTLYATVKNQSGNPVSGKTVNFANSNEGRFSLNAGSCVTGGTGECTVTVSASDFNSTASTTVTASCTDCASDSSNGNIIKTPVCNISCPDSYTVAPDGAWHSYSCSVSGEAGCRVDSCSKFSGSSKISVRTGSVLNTCEVMADTSARYDTAVSRARAGTGSDDTNIIVKALGWIETNP